MPCPGLIRFSPLRTILIALSACLLLFNAQAHAAGAPHVKKIAGLSVGIWLPSDYSKTPVNESLPVIIFSHGFHGCMTQSTFLMEALAKSGYAVFAPNHADAACAHGKSGWMKRSAVPFKETEKWSSASYAGRRDDIEKLITALMKDRRYAEPRIDWNRLGLVGHSLGGYTVLGLAGGWPDWKDTRVKAVLALSPYAAPYILQKTLGGIHAPVMYQGGTRDSGITPALNKGNGAYDQTPKPKYYVEFDGAGHFAWTNLRATYHDIIDAYSVAFFDRYLKNRPFPSTLMRKGEQVSNFRADW
jgi:predicted dienelactone hydrolase